MLRNGFTLIEVLAILVILSIIAVIAYPKVTDVIIESREAYVSDTIESLEKAANIYISTLELEEANLPLVVTFENKKSYYQFNGESKIAGNILELKGGIPTNGKVVIYKDKTYEYQVYNERTNKCIKKDITNYINASDFSLSSFGTSKSVSAGTLKIQNGSENDVLMLDFDITYEDMVPTLDKDYGISLKNSDFAFEKVKVNGSGFQHFTLTRKLSSENIGKSYAMNFVFDYYETGKVTISNIKVTRKNGRLLSNGKCI